MLIQLNVSGKQGGNFKSTQQMQIKKSKTKNKKETKTITKRSNNSQAQKVCT